MSIDLYAKIDPPVKLRELLPKMARGLSEMLAVGHVPELSLDITEQGQRFPADSDELTAQSDIFLISIVGEPETVTVFSGSGEYACVHLTGWRTKLEYAMLAAFAITIANESNELIEDDWGVFGKAGECNSREMFETVRLKATMHGATLREASTLFPFGEYWEI